MLLEKPVALAAAAVACTGCGTLIPLALKAAAVYFFPFLLFVSAEPPGPGDRPEDEALESALAQLRDAREGGLPSGWTALDREVDRAAGRPLVAYAVPADPELGGREFLDELRARHGSVRVWACDAGPMVADPREARLRLAALEEAGVVFHPQGSLREALEAEAPR